MSQQKGGTINFKVGGVVYDAKGSFTANLGRPKKEAIIGADKVHGFKEMKQVAFIEGVITDDSSLDVAALLDIKDTTVSLELANGKMVVMRNAWFAGEGDITTEEGEIAVRFEGKGAEEVAA